MFVFVVFLVSLLTEGYLYGVIAAFLGTVAVNYAFTFPYFALNFKIPVNLISGVIMIAIAILTSALTTKLKQHEATKAESEKERMRANLLRAVSHDLRTLLTTIYGSSTTLLENSAAMNEDQKTKIVTGIKEDSEWLIRMVENLLSITRIDCGLSNGPGEFLRQRKDYVCFLSAGSHHFGSGASGYGRYASAGFCAAEFSDTHYRAVCQNKRG